MTVEEKLIAYVDGELSPEERESFTRALAQDEGLRAELARQQELRTRISELHKSALDEEVPDRLTGLLTSPPRLPRLRKEGPSRTRSSQQRRSKWTNLSAVAASLGIGLFMGQTMTTSGEGGSGAVPLIVEGPLAKALDTQLASSQTAEDDIQIGVSFVAMDGQPCRTYETAGSAGLACRSGGEWRLKLIAPGEGPARSEYQQAGSSSELILQSAQEMLRDGPMDPEQEQQARDAGWTAGGEP